MTSFVLLECQSQCTVVLSPIRKKPHLIKTLETRFLHSASKRIVFYYLYQTWPNCGPSKNFCGHLVNFFKHFVENQIPIVAAHNAILFLNLAHEQKFGYPWSVFIFYFAEFMNVFSRNGGNYNNFVFLYLFRNDVRPHGHLDRLRNCYDLRPLQQVTNHS